MSLHVRAAAVDAPAFGATHWGCGTLKRVKPKPVEAHSELGLSEACKHPGELAAFSTLRPEGRCYEERSPPSNEGSALSLNEGSALSLAEIPLVGQSRGNLG